MTQKKKSIPLRVRFSLASTPEVANDIDSSAFALPCAIPLIHLTSASRRGALVAPRTPSVRVEEGGGCYSSHSQRSWCSGSGLGGNRFGDGASMNAISRSRAAAARSACSARTARAACSDPWVLTSASKERARRKLSTRVSRSEGDVVEGSARMRVINSADVSFGTRVMSFAICVWTECTLMIESSNGVYRGVKTYFNFFTDDGWMGWGWVGVMVKNGCSIEVEPTLSRQPVSIE